MKFFADPKKAPQNFRVSAYTETSIETAWSSPQNYTFSIYRLTWTGADCISTIHDQPDKAVILNKTTEIFKLKGLRPAIECTITISTEEGVTAHKRTLKQYTSKYNIC